MKTLSFVFAATVLFALGTQAQNWSVTSPNSLVKISLQHAPGTRSDAVYD